MHQLNDLQLQSDTLAVHIDESSNGKGLDWYILFSLQFFHLSNKSMNHQRFMKYHKSKLHWEQKVIYILGEEQIKKHVTKAEWNYYLN